MIILTLLIFASPLVYLGWQQYQPQIEVALEKFSRPVRQELRLHAPTLSWLYTDGKFIVDEKGNKKILRGVNVASINWGRDEWNEKAVDYVVNDWHANVIRTRIFQDEFEQDPEAFFAKIERQIIRPARTLGVYVILHPWIHNNQPLPDEGTIKMWRAIAERYQDDPTILYDVLAEPRDTTRENLNRVYNQLIQAVREVNSKSLIFVSGLEWGREINSWLNNPLPYPNIVYRSNPYNKEGEFEALFGQIAEKYPVFLGEFGADGYPPMSRESVKALLDYADQLGIGWTAWNFSAQGGCPCLLADEQRFLPSSYGQIVKDALVSFSQEPLSSPVLQAEPETDPVGTYRLYSDRLHHGFIDYSWGSQTDLLDPTAFSGKTSIKVAFKQIQSGFFLNTSLPVATNQYRSLSFWLKAESGDRNVLEAYVKDNQDHLSPRLLLAKYLTEEKQGWVKATIPLTDWGFANTQLTGFFLGWTASRPINDFYLDEIRLEK